MIPVAEPWFTPEDEARVAETVRAGWVSSAGRAVDEFEASWAGYCGRRFGIAMSSGTTALQAALAVLDLQPGDEVIVPAFTIIPCVLAVLYAGAVPVLVDADPLTWCMDAAAVEAKVSPRTRAVMPVHIYGHPVDMNPLLSLAQKHGLAVVEDAAEAHGAEYAESSGAWKRCGGFGQMSCFSFYANKLIATGEGGMVLTDDEALARRLRSVRDLCFVAERRFWHEDCGFNFRLTALQAALGLSQIPRMPELLRRKREMAGFYHRELGDLRNIQLAAEMPWARSSYWMFGVVLRDAVPMDAAKLALELRARGIETRPFFVPMHQQPAFQRRGLFCGERYPVAECLGNRGLYLPSGLGTGHSDFERVADELHRILRNV